MYKTDKRASLVILFFLLLGLAVPLLESPIDWSRVTKGGGAIALFYFVTFVFLHIFSYIHLYQNGQLVASLMALKKKTRVQDVTEIRRYPMYRGLSKVFGWQAAVLYKKDDGSIGYFEMSENLYSQRTMQTFFKKLTEMNKDIKLATHYQKLLERKTFRWYE